MSKLSVLMTVYNEGDFVDYAIRACLPHVDELVIVEGAYQEAILFGAQPRSTDGTRELCQQYDSSTGSFHDKNVHYLEANKETDKDQRNFGLEEIKKYNSDGWLLIIDGDEVYTETTLRQVKMCAHGMDKAGNLAAYFKSLTFVNDFWHHTEQEFPRLFKITPECQFVNDNFMVWPDKDVNTWFNPFVQKVPYIKYHHYAFCKGNKRFLLKKKWWETRFKKDFDYGWRTNEQGLIEDPNHKIFEYTGKHPEIMKEHPKYGLLKPPSLSPVRAIKEGEEPRNV